MQYFLVSLRYENYCKLLESDFELIGFPGKYTLIDSIKQGDKFVLYIGSGKSLIPGILEADGELYWDNEMLWDDIFPKRVKTKKYKILEENFVSMKEIKNGFSFIKPEVKKFGVYFMKGVRKLSEEDYKYICEKVDEIYNET